MANTNVELSFTYKGPALKDGEGSYLIPGSVGGFLRINPEDHRISELLETPVFRDGDVIKLGGEHNNELRYRLGGKWFDSEGTRREADDLTYRHGVERGKTIFVVRGPEK